MITTTQINRLIAARDWLVYCKFTVDDLSQKEIAKQAELSESRVKAIISEQRKLRGIKLERKYKQSASNVD